MSSSAANATGPPLVKTSGREAVARHRAHVELPRILVERALHLLRVRGNGDRVRRDRDEPEHEQRGRHRERAEHGDSGTEVLPRPEPAHEEEARERDPEEDRVGRVDDREDETGRRRRRIQRARVRPDRRQRKRERGGKQDVTGRGRGQREQRVRAAVPGREAGGRERSAGDGARRPRRPEEGPTGLVRDDDCDRGEDGREVEYDLLRVDAGDPRDEREEAVPERERVARVQPPVGELADPLEREPAELRELAHARQVEEPVTLDRARDAEEQDADGRASEAREPAPRRCALRLRPATEEPDAG